MLYSIGEPSSSVTENIIEPPQEQIPKEKPIKKERKARSKTREQGEIRSNTVKFKNEKNKEQKRSNSSDMKHDKTIKYDPDKKIMEIIKKG